MSRSPSSASRSPVADSARQPKDSIGRAASAQPALAAGLLALFFLVVAALARPVLVGPALAGPDLARANSLDLTTAMARKPSGQEAEPPSDGVAKNAAPQAD